MAIRPEVTINFDLALYENYTRENCVDKQENTHRQKKIVTTQRQFSIEATVETYQDESTKQGDSPFVHPDSNKKEKFCTDIIEIDDESSENIKSNKEEKVFHIRKVLPLCTSTTDSTTTLVKQYTISIESIRKAIEVQSKENNNELDKFLDIAIRNLHGQFGDITLSSYDEQVNRVLMFWKNWYEMCPQFRDTPLLYKCYLCYKGWWRLHLFKEHLKEHNSPNLKLKTEENHHEFYIVACTKQMPKARDVNVESNCLKCGNDGNFHRYTDKLLKYECEGCKQRIVTCSRLKEHEIICKDYIELICKRYNIKASEGKTCQICITYYAKQELLDRHLIDCHLVRTDEPIVLETKVCKLCRGRYFYYNIHDCPRNNKGFKCNNCCRKFSSITFRNIHLRNSKNKIKCMVCGKLMMECLAMEHYVKHTPNYSLLYYCGKCENNVLFSSQRHFFDHMRHHNSATARKRWGARMLLPTKCVNGDIVKSQIIFKNPNEKFVNFICGLEDTDGSTTDKNPLGNRSLDDVADEDVIIRNDDVLNNARLSRAAAERSKNIGKQTRELWAMEAQLDQEIKRDLEMEAEISKVFCASNSYLKFIEKELMERESTEKKLMDQEDKDEYDDDLIIDDSDVKEVTVISDSESENEEMVKVNTPEKSNSINNDIKTESGLTVTGDKYLESDVKDEIYLEPDDEHMLNDSKELDWSTSIVIDEADVDCNAIRMETDDFIPIDNVKGEKTESISTKGCEQMLRANTKEKKSDTVVVDTIESTKEVPKDSAGKVYKCKKCKYNGTWNQYIVHAITRCRGTLFNCTLCEREFCNLGFYLDHLVQHGYSHLTCPVCKAPQSNASRLNPHVTKHIQSLFFRSQHTSEESENREVYYVFNCKRCTKRVDPEQFFEHWQNNLNGGCPVVNGPAEKSEDEDGRSSEKLNNSDNDEELRLQPHVIKEVLDILKRRDRKTMMTCCQVCSKEFQRRNECKKHLIEHLLVQATMNRPTANDRLRCYLCPRDFILALDWKLHMREHSFLPAFKCEICSKSFGDSSNFSRHKKVHNLFSFICDLCGGKFNTKRGLETHLKMHEKSMLVCKYCQLPFINKSKLRNHEMTKHHTTPIFYLCTICRKRFISKKEKCEHEWVKHKHRNVCVDCPLCKKPFRRYMDLAAHMREAHQARY